MTDYSKVADALKEGASPEMLCMTCPWDRFCITPPSMTSDDIDRALDEAKARDLETAEKAKAEGKEVPLPISGLLVAITTGGRDTSCQVCPVFALRLRDTTGGAIVQRIRQEMQA